MVSPAWSAAIVQVPPPTKVTVEPATVQTAVVVEVKVTDNPEVAVAATVNAAAPNVLLPRALNEIVWLTLFTT